MHKLILILLLNLACMQSRAQESIRLYYGDTQYFGQKGQPQHWVNVLGNIADSSSVQIATFAVNGEREKTLTLGGDLHRLALAGDFNVEISWEDLEVGKNTLLITAYRKNGTTDRKQATLIIEKGNTWPMPYSVDFTQVKNLQQVVQVVDGEWELTSQGVRTAQRYYDRVLSMGDTTWKNYEVEVRLTLHSFTQPQKGPPTFDVTHFGIAHRWRGHHLDGRQPSRKWFPLGAQGEFMVKPHPDSCRWRILFGGGRKAPPQVWSPDRKHLAVGETVRFRSQTQTVADGQYRYRYKMWADEEPEPLSWDLEGYESPVSGYPSGALCLVPHNTEVTIHAVTVQPLTSQPNGYTARPGPGALHRSAPIGGLTGAQGKPFETECLPPGSDILAYQFCLGDAPMNLVKGFRIRTKSSSGEVQTWLIGHEEGNWQNWEDAYNGAVLTGIGGASGWLVDALRLYFKDGSKTPLYGGEGGDTTFELKLNRDQGRIRGFYGTLDSGGIETLGLLFDPAD